MKARAERARQTMTNQALACALRLALPLVTATKKAR